MVSVVEESQLGNTVVVNLFNVESFLNLNFVSGGDDQALRLAGLQLEHVAGKRRVVEVGQGKGYS